MSQSFDWASRGYAECLHKRGSIEFFVGCGDITREDNYHAWVSQNNKVHYLIKGVTALVAIQAMLDHLGQEILLIYNAGKTVMLAA